MKSSIILALALLTSCAVDPVGPPVTHDDPVLDDARPPTTLTHCLDQPAPPQNTAHSRTFRPMYSDLGGFEMVDQPVGIVSMGTSFHPAFAVLDISVGTTITGVSWSACGNGYADVVGAVWTGPSLADLMAGPKGRLVHHGSGLDSNRSEQWGTPSIGDFVPAVIHSGDVVGLYLTPYDGDGYVIGTVTITF